MKRFLIAVAFAASVSTAFAQTPPTLAFDSTTDFLKYSPDMNLGEVLGIAVNSKGHVVVLNHPGSAASGPLYGNATTQLLEFDQTGKFVREIGKGVYGLGYSHSVRFDKYDNLWVVDKGTNAVVKFNPAGYVMMNLGRRPEGPDDPSESYYRPGGRGAPPVHVDGMFRQPTDIAWDSDDNIYVSDGYTNSRVAKFDKNGNWIKSWGSRGSSGAHADENPGQFNVPHNIGIDRQNNIYVADRGNRRIQVFDTDGKFLRMIRIAVPYDKGRHPVLGNMPANRPDETQPWTICITNGSTQYLFTNDQEPGRIYKLTLDGKIVGMFGESGRAAKQFNWVHGLACPSDNTLIVADMNNWRVQKVTLRGATPSTASR
jgi:sugar lactone lactonase YvrE